MIVLNAFVDMAVVGLPTPRKNHATVMARFARDCRVRMQEVTVELAETMGEVCRMEAIFVLVVLSGVHSTYGLRLFTCLLLTVGLVHLFPAGYCKIGASIWFEFGSNHCGSIAWREGSVSVVRRYR
jgi:hypothetical protein